MKQPAKGAVAIDEELFASYMEEALVEARKAKDSGEVPIGAVVVLEGTIVGRGHNRSIQANDPTAHAEIEALRHAAHTVGNYRLCGAHLFVTIEPCAMCAGACVLARIDLLVFGARDPASGAVRSLYTILDDARLNHEVNVVEGIKAKECADLLKTFFQGKRRNHCPTTLHSDRGGTC